MEISRAGSRLGFGIQRGMERLARWLPPQLGGRVLSAEAVLRGTLGRLPVVGVAFAFNAGGISTANLGRLRKNEPADIPETSRVEIAGLREDQIKALCSVQIEALSPAQIKALWPAEIAALKSTQIAALSPAQIAVLRPNQIEALWIKALSPAQIKALADLLSSEKIEEGETLRLLAEIQRKAFAVYVQLLTEMTPRDTSATEQG